MRRKTSRLWGFLPVRPRFRLPGLAFLTLFTVMASTALRAENISPPPLHTETDIGFDRRGVPARIDIWYNAFGGSDAPENCPNTRVCSENNSNAANALVCLSDDNPQFGACPTLAFWSGDIAASKRLTLEFTHNAGSKKTLALNANRKTISGRNAWMSYATMINSTSGFYVNIPAAELAKLDQAGEWQAQLKMNVMGWVDCVEKDTVGCPGPTRAEWSANIMLRVTDTGTQQIYFPAFKHTNPRIDLRLSNRPGTGNNTQASGSNTLDMCLYDGSNSTSNRISLLFEDEGDRAPDRVTGRFSIYREGADREQAANRIDYQVSVIDPTTGSSQLVSNGREIIWTDTNRRNIQRQVVIPGLPGPLYCVPAPLTLTTPAFRLADKSVGHYTGNLRITYTPTTQTAP